MFGFMKKLTKLLPKERRFRPQGAHARSGEPFRERQPHRAAVSDGLALAQFGMGCFWGAERVFWQTPGVYSTAVGYAGGDTPNPTYEEVCTGSPTTPRRCWWCSTRSR
jgi:peptide-methionine (S)-S-oxide reductase